MADLDTLRELLRESLSDFRFSRRERQDLRRFLKDQAAESADLASIRSLAIEMAKETCEHDALVWLSGVNQVLGAAEDRSRKRDQTELLFSPRDDCPARIQALIRGAENTVEVCVFTITDDVITKELIRAHDRGLRVRIISDDEKAGDRGSDVYRLQDAGVPLALDHDGHMHHKFAVFDRTVSITGSYNWTRGAARQNHENILISSAPEIAAALIEEFEILWGAYSGTTR